VVPCSFMIEQTAGLGDGPLVQAAVA
jgi:hypothetical protein